MPHLRLEYSANVEEDVDMAAFCETMRSVAEKIEAFPTAGIRVRAFAADHSSVADGDPRNAFIAIEVRMRAGRALEVRNEAARLLFKAAEEYLEPVMDGRPLALSLELREMDPDLSKRTGSIRRFLKLEE